MALGTSPCSTMRWRLRKNNFDFPIEQKLFHLYVRMTGHRTQESKSHIKDMTSGVTPFAPGVE